MFNIYNETNEDIVILLLSFQFCHILCTMIYKLTFSMLNF